MQLNLPWVVSRKRLILAVIADGILFTCLYYILYILHFRVWPGLSIRLGVLLVIWVLSSYVIGRYVSGAGKGYRRQIWDFIGKQLIGTGTVLALAIGFTLLHFLLFNQNPVQTSFRSFLIPFLGSLAIISSCTQLLICRLSAIQDRDQNLIWVYVGPVEGFNLLKEMLTCSRLRVHLEHIRPESLGNIYASRYIVDRFYDHPASVLKELSKCQRNGSLLLSRLAWCEVVLQRFPPEFLSVEDLLEGGFAVVKGTFQTRLKRSGDIIVSALLLIITSPLILILGLLIRVSDRGPVFYSQIRTGLDGNHYKIWKLRTMKIDAERQGVQWSSRKDPRVTRIGYFLRRTRLDELPQLWCVLIGTMSLIGPRPERPEFDEELIREIPHYVLRHLIRPGLSGWAQVNYPYGASVQDSRNKLSYDLYYLKNFSFFLDLLILFKTIRLVFNAQGALPNCSQSN